MDFLRGHGYGYQIWVTAKNGFAFNGLGGQYAFCLPEKDLMFVCTGDIQGNNSATALIFSEVWHQIAERVQDKPFAEDPVANAKLQNRLENLSCHVPLGEAHVPFEAEVNGKWYTMNENMLKISRLMVEWNGESGVFHYVMDGVEKEFPFGAGKYELGVFPEKHYFGMTVSKPANRGYRCMSAGIWTEEKKLVLMVALKTAYTPAFGHLFSLLKSRIIGDIVEVNASVTTLTDENSNKLDSEHFGGSMSENACFPLLPIFKFLGTDYRNINFYSKMKNGVDMFTKAVFRYDHAVASFQVGLGVKTEGNMTIAGTKGYVYVPAPWWKTDYFEVRFEDQNQNKKYFYPFVGEGLRYEIKDFVTAILAEDYHHSSISKNENLLMAQVQETYINGKNVFKL
jgi:hypothetical protein